VFWYAQTVLTHPPLPLPPAPPPANTTPDTSDTEEEGDDEGKEEERGNTHTAAANASKRESRGDGVIIMTDPPPPMPDSFAARSAQAHSEHGAGVGGGGGVYGQQQQQVGGYGQQQVGGYGQQQQFQQQQSGYGGQASGYGAQQGFIAQQQTGYAQQQGYVQQQQPMQQQPIVAGGYGQMQQQAQLQQQQQYAYRSSAGGLQQPHPQSQPAPAAVATNSGAAVAYAQRQVVAAQYGAGGGATNAAAVGGSVGGPTNAAGVVGAVGGGAMAGAGNAAGLNSATATTAGATATTTGGGYQRPDSHHHHAPSHLTPAQQAEQQRLLTDATRRVQEHSYYMNQAIDDDDLPTALDRAASMLGELGDPNHHHSHSHHNSSSSSSYSDGHGHGHIKPTLNPKNYYELHMRCLDELPNLESYLVDLTTPPPPMASPMPAPIVPQPPAGDPMAVGAGASAGIPAGASNAAQVQALPQPPQPRYTAEQLYAAVQYTPRAVPRVYLQILAGSVLIKNCGGSGGEQEGGSDSGRSAKQRKRILDDLIDAVKCVQCPIRGLFLRHYLLGCTRDMLPGGAASVDEVRALMKSKMTGEGDGDEEEKKVGEEGKEGETKNASCGDGGDRETDTSAAAGASGATAEDTAQSSSSGSVADSICFLLTNFTEMNKLWVRIQHMPSASGVIGGTASSHHHHRRGNDRQAQKEMRKRRERERNELRLLVGTNLVRLSQLDDRYVTSEMYGEIILPHILEQIVACRDPLAQAYLMDCIIQVFPDEFHLATLETFLGVCPKLREKVNIRTIVGSMMDRLSNYFDDARLVQSDAADANEETTGDEGGDGGDGSAASRQAAVAAITEVDAFHMFDRCIQRVYTAKGSSMPPKEVIRLQTALLNFSLKVYPDKMGQISECLGVCAKYLGGGSADKDGAVAGGALAPRELDSVAVDELEKLLSIPLDSLALRVLELDHYSDLLTFLPWDNRRQVAVVMLNAVLNSGTNLTDIGQIKEMLSIITPLIQDEPSGADNAAGGADGGVSRTTNLMGALGVGPGQPDGMFDGADADPNSLSFVDEQVLVGKLVHLLRSDDTDVAYEMLTVARRYLREGGKKRMAYTLTPVVFAAFELLDAVKKAEFMPAPPTDAPPPVPGANADDDKADAASPPDGDVASSAEAGNADPLAFNKAVNCRKLFVFLQETAAMIAQGDPELGFKLYLQIASVADRCAIAANAVGKTEEGSEYSAIAYEIMAQAFLLYEDEVSDSKAQQRSIVSMVGTLLACRTFEKDDYDALVTKTAQYAAKLLKKADQCKTVMLCAHLFYPTVRDGGANDSALRNPQRVLECLQRALKIADACCMASPANVQLFVDILDQYIYFYENDCPVITDKFISGLVALISEHMANIGAATTDSSAVAEARGHFERTIEYIKQKKNDDGTAELFAPILV